MSNDDDKTRIAPRSTSSKSEVRPDDVPATPDKTVFKPRPSSSADVSRQVPPSDSTVIQTPKPRPRAPASVVGDEGSKNETVSDKVITDKNAGDKTVMQPRQPAAKSAEVPSDRTVMKPRRPATNPTAQGSSPVSNNPSSKMSSPPKQASTADASETQDRTRIQPTSQPISAGFITVPPVNVSASARSASPQNNSSGAPDLLKGRFKFETILGAGGMGVVYKAKDMLKVEAQDRDPYVAIKLLGDEFKSHPEAFIALQRESRKTQKIAHPNIVNVYDFDRDGDTVFMTMEYLEGQPLDKLISKYKATGLPEEDVWTILEGISAALIYAHGENIIHSDFKPGNIFVSDKSFAKVFDFGIARAVSRAEKFEQSDDDKTVFDAANLGALTPAYASLEMLEGETPDVRDDIYALGCIAYEMFTGRHPFNRVHANEARRQKLKPARIQNIPKRQWKIIEKALAFEREDRIATVDEFWSQLTRKKASKIVSIFIGLVVIGLASVVAYQASYKPEVPVFDEAEAYSEIERKFLIDQNQADIKRLLQSLEFSSTWEENLWLAVSTLRKLLGTEDAWLLEQEQTSYQAYLDNIETRIKDEQFDRARQLVAHAIRYGGDDVKSNQLISRIKVAEESKKQRLAREKEQAKQQVEQQKVVAQKKADEKANDFEFTVALDTVNKQLTCRNTMAMRDIEVAVDKLRSLDQQRYQKEEGPLVQKLAACITKTGLTFPERATEFKKRALRIFPSNMVVSGIKIEPKDPCDPSLAGLGSRGARAVCRDNLVADGTSLGKGPALVVIPSKGSLPVFAIGKYELTQGEFNKYCETTKKCSANTSVDEKLPATGMSAAQIKAYLAWLSGVAERSYRLPTRAEWMYAARAESGKLDSNRNCRLDSRGIKKGDRLIAATSGEQNDWGLINYAGNARELVISGGMVQALGGSYETPMQECVVTKSDDHSGTADGISGFRVLREISAKN